MRFTDDTEDSGYALGLRTIAGSRGLLFPARLRERPQTECWAHVQTTLLPPLAPAKGELLFSGRPLVGAKALL